LAVIFRLGVSPYVAAIGKWIFSRQTSLFCLAQRTMALIMATLRSQHTYKSVSYKKPVTTLFSSICLKPTHHLVVPFLLLPLATECRQLIADDVAFTDVEFG